MAKVICKNAKAKSSSGHGKIERRSVVKKRNQNKKKKRELIKME